MDTTNIIKKMHAQAQKLYCCDKFTGRETLEEVIELFKSPQGIEFCLRNDFPALDTLRLLSNSLTPYNIYVDHGEITLQDAGVVVLIGDTRAVVNCSTLSRHIVVAMHGARAEVHASGFAVVITYASKDSQVAGRTCDRGIIL